MVPEYFIRFFRTAAIKRRIIKAGRTTPRVAKKAPRKRECESFSVNLIFKYN